MSYSAIVVDKCRLDCRQHACLHHIGDLLLARFDPVSSGVVGFLNFYPKVFFP